MTQTAAKPTTGAIDAASLAIYQKEFDSDPKNRLALNAVTKNPVAQIALDRKTLNQTNHTFSELLKAGEAMSQERSGRCWLFAALNPMRQAVAEKLKLEKFELSPNYLLFWDKLEKANYFLQAILDTLDEPVDGRLVSFLLRDPIQDGGQWDMFVNLIDKYGILPRQFMPETESSANTGAMCNNITAKLREYASILRSMHSKGERMEELRRRKGEMVGEVYRMLAIHLGEPPREFVWQWRDKDDKFQRDGTITPREFYRKYVGWDLDDKVCLIHCPQESKQCDTMYTIEYLGNVVGGHIIRYLNVDLAVFKQATVDMLKDGKAVWFGCDVGKYLERDLGVLDPEIYDYTSVYDTDFGMDKGTRLDYGHSAMTHAMVFTGVDLDEKGKPIKWRVENSWGDKIGDKGFLVMSDRWFDEFMYEVVVDKKYLPKNLLPVLDTPAVKLSPWDPMGALASSPLGDAQRIEP